MRPFVLAAAVVATLHAAPAFAQDEEVVVRARKPPAQETIDRTEIRELPGAMGDPLRAVEVLPGVTPTVSGLPFFYVRGAPPNTVGFVVDDVPLPYLFHVGLGPSILHPAFVRSVALEPAGGEPRFGRAAGAFVTATTTEPHEDATWEARIRAIDASAFGEAPFADGKGHAAIGSTVSYTGPLLAAFAPDFTLDYRDTTARIAYDLTPSDRVTLLGIGSYDFAAQVDRGEQEILFASEIYRVDLHWDHHLEKGRGDVRAGITWGYDRSRLLGKRFARDQSIAGRVSYKGKIAKDWELAWGADARVDSYGADLPSPYSLTQADYEETARVFSDHDDTVSGLYGALVWRPRPNLELLSGARADVYTSQANEIPTFEPRARVAWSPDAARRVRLSTMHGIAHQTPAYLVPVPAVAIAGLPGGLQQSMQSSATAEVTGPLRFVGAVTAFRGVFSNLSDFVLVQSEFPLKTEHGVRGTTNGLELSVKRPVRGGWGLQLSYTLSRSDRREARGPARLSSYDRTHVFNAAVLFELGRGWTAGARLLTYTGLLRDPASGSDERLPAFMRIDARVGKRWKWGKTGYFGIVAEALNATAASETVALRCNDQGCTPRNIGPLTMPSVGIEGGM